MPNHNASNDRRTACNGKVRHRSKHHALNAIKFGRFRSRRFPYRCRFCGFWHTGNPNVKTNLHKLALRRRREEEEIREQEALLREAQKNSSRRYSEEGYSDS